MKNPTIEEKLLLCIECEFFKEEKCQFAKCKSCYNAILHSKFGPCPKKKWTVELPKITVS